MDMTTLQGDKLLASYRVLELTDEKGDFCGKILGDMGADVVKIERPGESQRGSLSWQSANTSKGGITLDITQPQGRELFLRLVKDADFLIESFSPGHLADLGLGYADLRDIHRGLIVTSITPFGQTGPYSGFEGPDLICMAMGGQMSLCGDPDRAPLRFSSPQSYPLAGAWAAAATLAANYHRLVTGEGQHIDMAIRDCVVGTCHNQQQFWDLNRRRLPMRSGDRISRGNVSSKNIWPCKDGYVSWRVRTVGWSHWTRVFTDWMEEEGSLGHLAGIDWESLDFDEMTQEEIDRLEAPFGEFFLSHTNKELFDRSRERAGGLFPLSSMDDLLEDPQLRERGFWVELEDPEGGTAVLHPGVPALLSEGLWRTELRPPRRGEHNDEIYRVELGLSRRELRVLAERQVI